MHRTLIALALLGVSTIAASSVQAQSVPFAGNGVSTGTMNYTAMPQVARDPKGIVAPQNGTAEEAYIKEQIRGTRCPRANRLDPDPSGTCHARAYKYPADAL